MEKIEMEFYDIFRHIIEYRGEEICVDIQIRKNKETKTVRVYTPIPENHTNAYQSRFFEKAEVNTMLEAKRKARKLVTRATTDIDTYLSEKEDIENFFDSLDESVNTLEQKFNTIERHYGEELEEI